MAKNDLISRQEATELIKEDYRTGKIDFIGVMLNLREIGHTPTQAHKIVVELIAEKHNGPRDN